LAGLSSQQQQQHNARMNDLAPGSRWIGRSTAPILIPPRILSLGSFRLLFFVCFALQSLQARGAVVNNVSAEKFKPFGQALLNGTKPKKGNTNRIQQ
jgi:hypothetical protein